MTASQNFDFISYCLINSFGQATVTFIIQNYGAGNMDRCRKVLRLSMMIGIAADIVLLTVMMMTRHSLILIFTTEPAVIAYAMVRFTYVVAPHFLGHYGNRDEYSILYDQKEDRKRQYNRCSGIIIK